MMHANSPDPLKIVILGGGGIARKAYLPLLRIWPGVRILGLYSRTQETVDEVCAEWQLEFGTTNLEALLELRPDAAFVLTSTPSHYALTHQLLEYGLDVFVEKPTTESGRQTRQLADLASSKGLVFMTGFNRRFSLLYRQAKEMFAGRRVQLCTLEKHRPSAFHISLYNNYLDDTIHQVDLLRFFCGDATPTCTTFEMRAGKVVGAVSLTELRHGGKAVVLTSLQAGAWQERAVIHGDGLTIEVSAFRELRVKHPDREEVFGGDRPGKWSSELAERGFRGEIEHFVECIHERKEPETNGYEAARTQELVEAMVARAGEQTRVTPHAARA